MKLIFQIFLFICSLVTLGQNKRSGLDTTHWQIRNPTKSHFWGNSTYISSSITFARHKELDFNIGRSNGLATFTRRGLGDLVISSWGIGYTLTNINGENKQGLKAFYEYNYFPFIILGNFALRGEFIHNFTDNQNYLRPSIGLTFIFVDLSYSYSFLLNGIKDENLYRHGLSVRAKYFINRKKWEKHYFNER